MSSRSSRRTADQRKEALSLRVSSMVSRDGMRVESQSDYQAVLVKGKRVNHILHLILTLITLGMWGFVWILLVIIGGERRSVVRVDEFGNILTN